MLIILYLLFSMHVVISHYEYMHVYEYYIIFAMLMSYLPVFANRGSCSFAMLCRRGWFKYSLSLCEDYIFNKLSSNSGFNSPLGGSGIVWC